MGDEQKAVAPKGLKEKKSRHFRKEILKEDSLAIECIVKHKPVKGEKISDTRRKDHKFNPKQVFFAGRPL